MPERWRHCAYPNQHKIVGHPEGEWVRAEDYDRLASLLEQVEEDFERWAGHAANKGIESAYLDAARLLRSKREAQGG